jgi:hypothetical protein
MRATLLVLAAATALHADVLVTTSLQLTQLQIQPTTGSVDFLSPWTSFVFAQAEDSLGGLNAKTNSVSDSATSVSAATALANGSSAASFPAMGGSAMSGVTIGPAASASSTGQGQLSGSFEIVGVTGPVSVALTALLSVDQSLSTTAKGLSASSETVFNLVSPDLNGGNSLLFFDNPLNISAGSSTDYTNNPTLTTTVTLNPDTPYFLIAGVDAESSGNNIPEPSLFAAVAAGLAAMLLTRRLRQRREHPH